MYERGRDMRLFDRRMDILCTTASDAIDEVGEMVSGCFARWSRFCLISDPRLVRIVAIDSEVSVRSIEDVSDRVGLRVLRTQRLFLTYLLPVARRKSGSRDSSAAVGT